MTNLLASSISIQNNKLHIGTKEKAEDVIEKANAENESDCEKNDADLNSEGMGRDVKHVRSEIKKDLRFAKANLKEKIN